MDLSAECESRSRFRSLIGLLLAATACSAPLGPSEPDFGAMYSVAPTPAPLLTESNLRVTVQYGGCQGGHAFELRYHVRSAGAADVWLHKLTPDQPCDMLVTASIEFPLPQPVRQAATVTLLAPDDEFLLR